MNHIMSLTFLAASVLLTAGVAGASPATDRLNDRFGVAGRVVFADDVNGEPSVRLMDGKGGFCVIRLRGAHVTSCAFAGDAHPLLYVPCMGYEARPEPRDFIHGGLPLLWPWFGSSGAPELPAWRRWLNVLGFSFETEAPFHATARLSLFGVRASAATDGETSVTLVLGPCEEVSEFTEGAFELEYRISLGEHALGLRLATTNAGGDVFRYREGIHPYFCVSDCFAVTLDGVDGCTYESSRDLAHDVTHVWKGKVPEWPGCDIFSFKEEKSVITLEDPAWGRNIVLTTTGARDVVTWCQDVKGASPKTMNILPFESNLYFCIEPANFHPTSEIALKPGESHVFESVITVTPAKASR